MRAFKPSFPYTTPIELLIPTYSSSKGVQKKTYPKQGIRLNCSFKTYGGTEGVKDGVYSVIDTAQIETWFRPDIKPDCKVKLLDTGEEYEIVGKPEDIDRRHQFIRFKVHAVEGGA